MGTVSNRSLAIAGLISLVAAGSASAATFDLSTGTNVFAPSFRGESSTTYFGWGSGSFDGTPDNELIDSPAPTLGNTTLAGVNLVQNHSDDILSSTNNIYTSSYTLELTLTAPTAGTPSSGFTTIIVQGKAAFGGFGSDPAFSAIAGVTPSVAVATNAAAAGQFFVKYEIPGNAATYDIGITGGTFLSLNTLTVDTLWSPTSYSADIAVTPEPASLGALAGGLVLFRRSRRK